MSQTSEGDPFKTPAEPPKADSKIDSTPGPAKATEITPS